jgi:hypothetical protein
MQTGVHPACPSRVLAVRLGRPPKGSTPHSRGWLERSADAKAACEGSQDQQTIFGFEVSFHMSETSFFDVRSHSHRSSEQSYRSGLGAVKLEIEKTGSSHVEPQD